MNLSLKLALRGLAASKRDVLFHAACVLIGVAALVGVRAMSAHLQGMINQDARALLAADLRLQAARPLGEDVRKLLQGPGRNISESLEFTTNVMGIEEGGRAQLVEVKAVTLDYPLRGQLALAGGITLAEAFARGGAVAEPTLFSRLGLKPGDAIKLGRATFPLAGVIDKEPDRVTGLFRLGPRILIPLERVAETGLIQMGSRIRYVLSVNLAPGESPAWMEDRLKEKFLSRGVKGVRVMTPAAAQPMARRFINRLTLFLTLTSLAVLLVGGLGIAASVRARIQENRAAIAVMKCVGMVHDQVMTVHMLQVLIISLPAALLGAGLGAAFPWLLLNPLAGLFPQAPPYAIQWLPVLSGAMFGLLAALSFSLAPLMRIRGVSPNLLFRRLDWSQTGPVPKGDGLAAAGAVVLMGGLLVYMAGDYRLGLMFLAGLAGTLLLLALTARLGLWLLARFKPKSFAPRQALAGLTRAGGEGRFTVMALGLGLVVVMTTILLERNLVEQLESRLPERAPSFFFLDIQPAQADSLARLLEREGEAQIYPIIRGRLIGINGKKAAEVRLLAEAERWRFNRQYVLTASADLPKGNELIAGGWWSGPEEEGMSIESGMAKALGLDLGDSLTFDIQGIPVSAPIKSIRKLHWSDMGLNFFVVFAPKTLEGAPMTHMATGATAPHREEGLLREITGRFPNVTAIPTREVMETIKGLLLKVGEVIRLVGGGAALSGVLVLLIGVSASRRRRNRESALFRLLGAERKEAARIVFLEFFFLGLLAALAAALAAQAVTAVVIKIGMDDLWQPHWLLLVGMAAASGVVTGAAGYLSGYRELGKPVRQALRRWHGA